MSGAPATLFPTALPTLFFEALRARPGAEGRLNSVTFAPRWVLESFREPRSFESAWSFLFLLGDWRSSVFTEEPRVIGARRNLPVNGINWTKAIWKFFL